MGSRLNANNKITRFWKVNALNKLKLDNKEWFVRKFH